jgi:tRNA(fMet)-specific endonuclease VapC
MIVVYSSVFIEVWRATSSRAPELETLLATHRESLCVTSIIRAELVVGALNSKELERIERTIRKLTILPLSLTTMELFDQWIVKFALSHRPKIADLLIAATCVAHGAELLTLNVRDFRYLPELRLVEHSG